MSEAMDIVYCLAWQFAKLTRSRLINQRTIRDLVLFTSMIISSNREIGLPLARTGERWRPDLFRSWHSKNFGVRRQSEAAAALWIIFIEFYFWFYPKRRRASLCRRTPQSPGC